MTTTTFSCPHLHFPHFPHACPHLQRLSALRLPLVLARTRLLSILPPGPFPACCTLVIYLPVDFPFSQSGISAGFQIVKVRTCSSLHYQRKCCTTKHLLETLNFPEQFHYWHRITGNSQGWRYNFCQFSNQEEDMVTYSVSLWVPGLGNPGPAESWKKQKWLPYIHIPNSCDFSTSPSHRKLCQQYVSPVILRDCPQFGNFYHCQMDHYSL